MRTREPRGPTQAPDRVDALRVRLDRDLGAVARLAGDAADLDETVRDLGHLELEERLDQLRVAPREDHLRPLRARAHLGDHSLDAGALLVTLAVDLLGARQQRLDVVPEVDEHVVAVAGLLHDAGDDVADPVDVLGIPDRALRLADALLDHLLRGHRGDAAEVAGGDVGARRSAAPGPGPVEVEIVVGDKRVLLLAGLLLDPLELRDRDSRASSSSRSSRSAGISIAKTRNSPSSSSTTAA